MASLNLSTNGPSITKSYQSVLNAPPPSGAAASSPTYGQWAIFVVQAPLANAFQNDGSKESVMKVQTTGEGELQDFIEEFSDGRIQFGLVKIKDTNTSLPKTVFVGWCGEGVPERTKGYFTSHMASVGKLFQGYHVQITARSESDISPERILQKVADASGSKYSGGGDSTSTSSKPPPVGGKPVFMPTRVGGGQSQGFNPLASRSRAPQSSGAVDNDGWGADAPEVTRSQLEKVPSAYKPTKVNLAELTSKPQEPSRFTPQNTNDDRPEVVRGAYQPVGKINIEEIRRQAKQSGQATDDRPTPVKGAYEPIGKVDIAAIKARSQAPQPSAPVQKQETGEDDTPKSLSERSAAFQQSERLTSLPRPKVANRFSGGPSSFTGTKAPTPVGFASKTNAAAAPVGVASRTFADEGGKTPAQIWAEKKARQGGSTGGSSIGKAGLAGAGAIGAAGIGAAALSSQTSGEGGWKSGYSGKSWAPVATSRTGQSAASGTSDQRPAEEEPEPEREEREENREPKESISSIRERFAAAPPPMDITSKPNSGRPVPPPEEEEEEPVRPSSPIRVAMPVARNQEPEPEPEEEEEQSMPIQSMSHAANNARDVPAEPKVEAHDPARSAGMAVAESNFGAGAASAAPGASKAGKRAIVQYDYEKAEDNELELKEGEYVTNIDMVDEDWWMGQNAAGESGLFPANYVELVEDEEEAPSAPSAPVAAAVPTPIASAPSAAPAAAASQGKTATAQYDYEAAEDNELSFPDGATIINVEFPDDDWWLGEFDGKTGLFPANYVTLDE